MSGWREVDVSRSETPVLVYILAASHSGSTLAAMMLNAHPDIYTAGELKANNLGDTEAYRCSCQALIGDCPFWQAVSTEMRSRGLQYDVRHAGTSLRDIPGAWPRRLLRPLHRGRLAESLRDGLLWLDPRWRQYYAVWQTRNLELIRAIGRITGAKYVADSSKIGIRLKYLCRLEGLQVKVLRVVRDGRAVALTYMDPGRFADARDPGLRGGGSGAEHSPHELMGMERAAAEWRRSNEEAEAILATISADDQLRISYEDLCLDTESTMTRVHDYLGVVDDKSYLAFRDAPHHIVGNGMRLDSSSEVKLDDRWRRELRDEDLAVFDRVAGAFNARYGYH